MAPAEPSHFEETHNPLLLNTHLSLRQIPTTASTRVRQKQSFPSQVCLRFSLCSFSFAACLLVPGAFNIPAQPLSTHESRHKLSVKKCKHWITLRTSPERKTLELCPQERQERRQSCCWRRWPSGPSEGCPPRPSGSRRSSGRSIDPKCRISDLRILLQPQIYLLSMNPPRRSP